MLTGWECYLWLKLDTIITALTLIGIGLPAFFVIKALLSEENQKISKPSKLTIYLASVIGAICLFLAVVIPSTKEFAAIYILPKLTSNPHVVKELKTSSSRTCCKLLLSYTNQLLKEVEKSD